MYFACEKYIQSLGKEKEGCPARVVVGKSFSESTGEKNSFPHFLRFLGHLYFLRMISPLATWQIFKKKICF